MAETTAQAANSWIVVTALGALLSLGVAFFALVRAASGKAGERQIEPTQLAALQQEMRNYHVSAQAELREQTNTLKKLDRESGETRAQMNSLREEVGRIRTEDIRGIFTRMNAISTESTETRTRVGILEPRLDALERSQPKRTA